MEKKATSSLKSAQLCAQFENTCLNLNISHCTKTRYRLLVTQEAWATITDEHNMVDTLLNTFGNIFQYFEFHLKKNSDPYFYSKNKKKDI